MNKSVIINLGSGDLYQGFPRVTVQLWTAGNPRPEQFIGTLPAAPALVEVYRNWQLVYRGLCDRIAGGQRDRPASTLPDPSPTDSKTVGQLVISEVGITNVSQVSFDELCQQLQVSINTWLKSEGFLPIELQLRSRLNSSEQIRVMIETHDLELRHLPWHRWEFFDDYPKAEMALSQPEYQYGHALKPAKASQKVRILAVLGNSSGIDLATETRLLRRLQDAEVQFLVNPSRQEFNHQLWQSEGWDMLFFAGHSQTQGETGRIYINENPTHNSLTIPQLEEALKAAIANGLRLAIFNSCDGLGLAQALEKLNLPTVIVMREPVPNRVAQEFFQQFLAAFALNQLPLYLAVQHARRKLQGLEDDFPAASWLPVICQNLAVESPTWLQLGGMPPCPYRGLFAFREEDTRFFFGREQATQALLVAVKQKPLVAVIGASGSGKSSVVFAGLVPLLRQKLFGRDAMAQAALLPEIVSFRPGNDPFAALAAGLAQSAAIADLMAFAQSKPEWGSSLPHDHGERTIPADSCANAIGLEQQLRQDNQGLANLIQRFGQQNSGMRLILIADQFEELYTLCPEAERQPFLDAILNAVKSAPAFTLILTLRADFCGYALAYRPLSDALQGAIQFLGPMNEEELQAAIAKPAAQLQVRLEHGLIQKLIHAMNEQPGRLPLLEFALTQLWSNQRDGWLTNQAYDEIGGVEEALANHAEFVYAQLSNLDQRRSQQVFIQLVQPGTGTDDSRRLAIRDDVLPENWDLVNRLASARLVVTNRNESTGEETVEIVHEALIRGWERLRNWMQLDGEFRLWQEQLRAVKRQWEKSDQDEGALLQGKALADADYWQQRRQEELSLAEQTFIQQSLSLRDRDLKFQSRRQKLAICGLSGGLITALMLTVAVGWQWRQSNIGEIEALSKSSEALFATNKKLEALVEAIRAKRSFQRLVGQDMATQTTLDLMLNQATYGLQEYNRLPGKIDGVKGVSFSPDGQMIASIPENNTIKLWHINGTLKTVLIGHSDAINGLSFSPDGQMIASVSNDKTIRLWNLNGTLLKTFKGHGAEVTSLSFSPDGQTIASASNDKTIKLWNLDGALQTTLTGHDAEVTRVSFSPDGRAIASASNDQTIKLWNLNGTLLRTFKGHGAEVTSVSFSPDGRAIASASNDQTIKLWHINGTLLKTIGGHSAEVTDVSFSPDGQTIASASADKTVKVWRSNGTLLTTLEGHGDIVWGVDFSPDSKTIASASWDATVRLWHYQSPLLTILSGHTAGITGVSFSPDGKTVATASDDKTVKLWNVDGKLLRTLAGHLSRVYAVSFSPDGQTLASAADDKTIKLWKLDGTLLKTLTGHSMAVWDVKFSPDGQTLASAADDKTIKLWKLDGTLLKTLTGHQGTVFKAIFSPDGKTIISVSNDKTIKLWKLDGTLLKTIQAHDGTIPGIAISPNRQVIASGSKDRTIKLWQTDGLKMKTIQAHDAMVQALAFSPDGRKIASFSVDNTVKLWSQDGTLLKTLKRHGAAVWGGDYSPNGQMVASASADNTVILWNLKQLLELNELDYACKQIHDYLQNNQDLQARDRALCD
ncbi:MAG: CHAT domain-containing protein [Aphanocapsa sp. GSE-SYN-MK-11-07L]|jgi:WD40 repeat protein|nr:CHAT domain-containing protein [Aphanocapsa sp. GSE-SYN-MK-11-07L]